MRVVIAYDGSAGSAKAVALTEAIPWPRDTVLRVVNVIEPILTRSAHRAMWSAELEAQLVASADETLQTAIGRLGSVGSSVEGQVLRGRVASTIIEDAEAFDADLIIVGSRGNGAIATLLLGSVASEVVDHASCPVLVARDATLTRAVFATDGSPAAQAAEAILARWPIFAHVAVHIVSVAEVVHPWALGVAPTMYRQVVDAYAADLRESKAEHLQMAQDAAARYGERGRDVSSEVREGDAAREILAVAQQQGADLVVLGSRGRTGLTRLLLGSVARNVLLSSTASVLIVHEPADGTSEQGVVQ